jgi:hypothetical protein
VCMFNSFALAGPFCERMKIPPAGGDRLPDLLRGRKRCDGTARKGGCSVEWGRSAAICFAPPWARS